MRYSNRSNTDWIKLIKSSDSDAITDLFNILVGFLINKLEGQRDSLSLDLHGFSEDIAQDTVISIHKNIHHYRQESKFLAWACAIARNKAVNQLRWKQHDRIDFNEDYSVMSYGLDLSIEDRDSLDYLKQIILSLDLRQQFVIEQTYLYYSEPEWIANELDITVNNYYLILHRSLDRIRHLVHQDTLQNRL